MHFISNPEHFVYALQSKVSKTLWMVSKYFQNHSSEYFQGTALPGLDICLCLWSFEIITIRTKEKCFLNLVDSNKWTNWISLKQDHSSLAFPSPQKKHSMG